MAVVDQKTLSEVVLPTVWVSSARVVGDRGDVVGSVVSDGVGEFARRVDRAIEDVND